MAGVDFSDLVPGNAAPASAPAQSPAGVDFSDLVPQGRSVPSAASQSPFTPRSGETQLAPREPDIAEGLKT